MYNYTIIASWRDLKTGYYSDPLDWDLKQSMKANSLKQAIQEYVNTKAFDEYLYRWNLVWIYLKTADGKIHYIPQWYDIEI